MTKQIDEYYAALLRLESDKPFRVPKGTKITNDAVALESGRGKGSIKKSRPVFFGLIEAINTAAENQAKNINQEKAKLHKAKASADQYREELEAALAREVSLLYELYELKKHLSRVTGVNVLPIRGNHQAEK